LDSFVFSGARHDSSWPFGWLQQQSRLQ
jgi:hypothetical protein